MKMRTKYFNGIVEWDEEHIGALVIENPKIMRRVIRDIQKQMGGEDGGIILFDQNEEVKYSSEVELIWDILNIDCNTRKILTRINKKMEEEALKEENYATTMEVLNGLEKFAIGLSEKMFCQVEFTNISIESVIKMLSIKVVKDTDEELALLLDYILLVREIEGDKIFIIFNIKALFDEKEIEEFVRSCIAHKLSILLLDVVDIRAIENEKKTLVDYDLCVI